MLCFHLHGRRLQAQGVEQVGQALDAGWLRLVGPAAVELKTTLHLLRSTR
jgi:hypothetical protein